jgi:SlyX protein
MSPEQELAERIEALEMTVAFQDQTIEELNQALTSQWNEIDALKRELSVLRTQLREVEANPALAAEDEPPPPHY